jgi:hypothetical protein
MSFFSDLFNPTQKLDQAAQVQQAGLQSAQQQAMPWMQQGIDTLKQYYGNAATTLQNPLGTFTGGSNLYADLTGANGPEGQARAQAAFQTDPGYNFARDEALKATERTQGTGGFQGSGNVLTALQDRASGLASQQYGNWAARLQPFLGQTADLSKALAAVYGTEGGDLTSQQNSIANLLYGTQTGIANAGAAALTGGQSAINALGGQIIKTGGDLASKLLGYATGTPTPAKPAGP